MSTNKPLAFISHAGEDKVRFVMPFAKKLLEHGVDVWVDKWEMLPGDSLVDKIFEEGIKKATAFIIVLSKNSVQKRWVREELNAGLIKRISGQCKVIPVVIDDCEIPEAVHTIIWEKIKDLDNYEEELDRIVASIHGISQKPSVGISPKYTRLTIDTLPGLSKIDVLVLKASCDNSIQTGNPFVGTSDILSTLEQQGISPAQTYESLEILDEKYYIKAERELGSDGINFFSITTYGFENFGNLFIEDFDGLVNQTLIAIINNDLSTNSDLSKHFSLPQTIIDYVLDILASRKLINIEKYLGGTVSVTDVSTSGRRVARGG